MSSQIVFLQLISNIGGGRCFILGGGGGPNSQKNHGTIHNKSWGVAFWSPTKIQRVK